MVLDLYVAPPAFGLPSYDPECVAAVAYLSRCMKEEEEQEWRLRAWLGAGSEYEILLSSVTISPVGGAEDLYGLGKDRGDVRAKLCARG